MYTLTYGQRPVSFSFSVQNFLSLSNVMCLNVCICMLVGDEHMMWQCLGLLQEGLSHSPSNAQFKLLLLLLYCRLGAFEPVVDLYSSLDAKHVQHDTIGSVQNMFLW